MVLAARVTVVLLVIFSVGLYSQGEINADEGEREAAMRIRIELSYVRTSGNTDTETLAGMLEIDKYTPLNRYLLKASIIFANQDGNESSNKLFVGGRWERSVNERVFGFLNAGYERDKFSGYDYRFYGGPGLGYEIIRSPQMELTGRASFTYNHDSFSEDILGTNDYASYRFDFGYSWRVSESVRFKGDSDYSVSFEDSSNYFMNSLAAVEVSASRNISIGVSYLVNYRNLLLMPGLKRTDTTLLTSIIIDF